MLQNNEVNKSESYNFTIALTLSRKHNKCSQELLITHSYRTYTF